jgi:hypothetical protein
MKPKEKAKKMLSYYYSYFKAANTKYDIKFLCKESALITVDEIILANPHSNPFNTYAESTMSYWQEVKREIQML